jgi:type 1 glutamine amidotransferase
MRVTRGSAAGGWVAVGAAWIAAGAASPAEPAEQRVLLVTDARGFVHDSIPEATAFFEHLGERSATYDVIQVSGAGALTAQRLRNADAVVFANTSGEVPVPDRGAFLRFVHRGGAFIGTHSASDTLHSWPGYARLLGGEFLRHGAVQSGRVNVVGRPHAVTRGLPRSFILTDEFYEFDAFVPEHTRVLGRLAPESVGDEGGRDLPLVWARRYGKGRVFYNALGHLNETWRHRTFRRLVARGVAWALGSS